MLNVAIMGHGTVGSGVAEILLENKNIKSKVNNDINIKYILDIRDFDGLSYSDKFTKNFDDILNDESVKIVAEVMGGLSPAYEFVKQCLQKGKSVVTSNKELVASKGDELLKIAKENNVNFLFEASVGGGIPILRPLSSCLAANNINKITGILNGTTNYILNKMIVDNMDFDSALQLAQSKGFAERNPAADIEGHDACRKICILASLAFGKHVYPEQVQTEGITDITLRDVEYANNFNCVIKLICQTEKISDKNISASVRPMLVSRDNIISDVDGVFNAIMVNGDAVGDVLFYGKGAGKMPTASAVVADIIDCANHSVQRKNIGWECGDDNYVINPDTKTRLYVLAKAKDFNILKNSFKSLFSDNTWNVCNDYEGEIAFITNEDYESDLRDKISKLSADSIKIMNTLL